jgi:hypothetical protein
MGNPNGYKRENRLVSTWRGEQLCHVAQRVWAFVKAGLFQKIKFVNNDAMFQKAIDWVMDQENVAHCQ